MGSRKWWGLVVSLVLVSACYGGMTAKAELDRGLAYGNGAGVPQNYQKSNYWLRKAAMQGNAIASEVLAHSYRHGIAGVSRNYQKALFWLKKAAAQGSGLAKYRLAVYYFIGKYVPQNYVRAYKWMILAKAGAPPSKYEMVSKDARSLVSLMSPSQIARAQSMAAAWERAHEK